MAPYDVFQQTFGMSIASNAAGAGVGTQEDLQKVFEERLPALLAPYGEWAPIWGPTLWKNAPENAETGPDHAWVVLRNPAVTFDDGSVHDTYVVAIAGTARNSQYDWSGVNLRVGTLVDFDAWVAAGVKNVPGGVKAGTPTVSYVSIGAALAVQKLFAIAAPTGVAGAGTNLYDFFAGLGTSGPSRIIFTGHSLVKHYPSPANVRVYMTAGPSPGNGPFVTAFSAAFPPMNAGATYQVWNQNIYNTLDVNTSKIPKMYGTPGPLDVRLVMNQMNSLIGGTGVVYKPMPGRSFPGVPSGLPTPKNMKEFLAAALSQHELPYHTYIISHGPPVASKHETLGHGVAWKTLQQVLYSSTVLGELAVWAEHIEEVQVEVAAESGRV
ncbi:hypothetical protein BD779DRAFT_1545611 [Infundibulicybe gibba]|nr:hypothetical protein BD779DRAFT_1545611 [Infundibulicybe gibba]